MSDSKAIDSHGQDPAGDSEGGKVELTGGTDSPLWASLTTVNLVVGVGLLYLPGAFITSGIMVGIVMCCLVAAACYYTTTLIVRVGHQIGKYSYEEICLEVLGSWGYYCIAISCILLNWGACLCYVLSINKMASPVIIRLGGEAISDWEPYIITLIIVAVIMLPLSLMKDLSALSFVSAIKAVVIVITIGVVLVQSNLKSVQDYQDFKKWNYRQAHDWFEDVADKSGVMTKEFAKEYHGSDSFEWTWDYFLRDHFSIPPGKLEDDNIKWNETAPKDVDLNRLLDHIERASELTLIAPRLGGSDDKEKKLDTDKEDWDKLTDDDKKSTSKENPHRWIKAECARLFRKLVNRNNPKAQDADDKELKKPKNKQQPEGWSKLGYLTPYWYCSQFVLKIGTFCMCFVFHDSIFSVHKQVPNPSPETWKQTATYALSWTMVLQIVFSVVVALSFGTEMPIDNNCLNGDAKSLPLFPIGDTLTTIVQLAFSFILILTYPVCLVLCREYVESIITLYTTPRTEGKPVSIDPADSEFKRVTSLTIAFILVLTTLPLLFDEKLAMLADDVLDVFGCTLGIMAFCLPSICFWAVFGRTAKDRSTADRYLPWLILIPGAIVTAAGTILKVLELCGAISSDIPSPPPLS